MKLAVAVLSSILLVCSATTANPVKPSATTNTEHRISAVIPSTNGIGIDNLSPLPGNVKHLLDKYAEIEDGRNQQSKIYWPLKSRYDSQYDVLMGVKKDLKVLEYLSQDDDGLKYYIEIRKTKLDHEKQLSKLDKIRKSFDECQFKIGLLVEKIAHQALLIKETPSVNDYIEKQSLKYESIDQKSGGRRKRKDLESSDEESSEEEPDEESKYKFNRKGTFSMRRASSKFITRFGSFFQKSKRDDPSN
ncbi:hypothetical protein O5D80_003107 [Batrachochytrium dendrobatidis]|nr:hypothetical protein O5D80_000038 [Batrachochytrium dendrobatidis]KAJ8329163.1 hypothetical protein O5D80_003107 [Batrachochytrium dendrobatidis]